MSPCRGIFSRLFHKRTANLSRESSLKRCLNTFDLTILGIGSCLGAGLYVVTGELARDVAGPSVVISFFIAAVAAFLSGLCYAEYCSRVPTCGSAYSYSYLTLGELIAFIVGWNMSLEYIISGASVARACSENINSIAGGKIYEFFIQNIGSWHESFLGSFPDFLALFLLLCTTIIACLGVRKSSIFNAVTTIVNIIVILLIIFGGMYFINTDNWSSPEKFAPFGVGGILTAAGSAFFATSGFEIVASAGEEAINPRVSLPVSIILSLSLCFLCYFGVTAILTLIIPYNKLSQFAALADAFATRGLHFAKYIISIGAICATSCVLQCTTFSAARVIYTMAQDGLLFEFLSHVNQTTKVPVRATLVHFCIAGGMALLLDIKQLVEMVSIGTLVAYSSIALGVILTRYEPDVASVSINTDGQVGITRRNWLKTLCCAKQSDKDELQYQELTDKDSLQNESNNDESSNHKANPTSKSYQYAVMATISLVIGILGLTLTLSRGFAALKKKEVWAIVLVCVFGLQMVVSFMILRRQPRNHTTFPFMVPGCPYTPTAALFINVLLIVNLSYWTYVRVGVWMTIGFLIYGFYGYRHSIERKSMRNHDNQDNETEKHLPFEPIMKQPQEKD